MDVNDWLLIWLRVATHPSQATFEEERKNPEATLSTALLWMALAVVVSGAFALVHGMYQSGSLTLAGGINGMLNELQVPPELEDQLKATPLVTGPLAGVGAAGLAILTTLAGFLLSVGVLFVTARMVGGTGKFGRYAYLIAAFSAPLSIITSLIAYIPYAGDIVGVLLAIYQILLTYFAVKVEHNLSRRRTIIAMIIPTLLVLLVAGGIALASTWFDISWLDS